MRDCPVCESPQREVRWRQTFEVPEGWTQPPYLDRCICLSCGMVYSDHPDMTQEHYDTYYREKYGFWGEGTEAVKYHKVNAEWTKDNLHKDALIVDFGGGREEIQANHLRDLGFTNVRVIDMGDEMPTGADMIICQQVLEHLYDLPRYMKIISYSIKAGGLLMVEGPEQTGNIDDTYPPIIDWQQKHINHFGALDYLRLMRAYGFEFVSSNQYLYYGIPTIHLIFRKEPRTWASDMYIEHIKKSTAPTIEGLKKLGNREVILWGCGDIAMHCISQHMPNIRYFVDKNVVFIGETIAGRMVKEFVADDLPIVVIAQGQKQDILDNIKREGLKNEVIIL